MVKMNKTMLWAAAFAFAAGAQAGEHGHGTHWSYEGENGPLFWGKFSPVCAEGKAQSPINIETSHVKKAKLSPLVVHYAPAAKVHGEVVNNGHTIKVVTNDAGWIEVGGKRFELVQFHFHSPSENHVNGRPYDMVAHFVHKAKDGQLAVVAVMFEEGSTNAALARVWKLMPAKMGEKRAYQGLNVEAILPRDRSYWHFVGSLTTPPCSEGVEWFVLKQPVSVGVEQWKAFRKLYFGNVRPTQPLNGREVEG